MKRKSKKLLAREEAQQRSRLKKACKAASLPVEEALLAAAPTLRFCGHLVVQSREAAFSTAIELCLQRQDQLVFFTDGAAHKVPTGKRNVVPLKQIKLGAAVAYRASNGSDDWPITSFSVALGGKHHYL